MAEIKMGGHAPQELKAEKKLSCGQTKLLLRHLHRPAETRPRGAQPGAEAAPHCSRWSRTMLEAAYLFNANTKCNLHKEPEVIKFYIEIEGSTCHEHQVMHGSGESLYCAPAINITLYVRWNLSKN